mmetsp:Transcript_11412/g.24631  ORF Transcript_11412/g.24631 Transcript_11412/m.24631 type:complete len:559 (+) Transcript_11412:1-1677(+)
MAVASRAFPAHDRHGGFAMHSFSGVGRGHNHAPAQMGYSPAMSGVMSNSHLVSRPPQPSRAPGSGGYPPAHAGGSHGYQGVHPRSVGAPRPVLSQRPQAQPVSPVAPVAASPSGPAASTPSLVSQSSRNLIGSPGAAKTAPVLVTPVRAQQAAPRSPPAVSAASTESKALESAPSYADPVKPVVGDSRQGGKDSATADQFAKPQQAKPQSSSSKLEVADQRFQDRRPENGARDAVADDDGSEGYGAESEDVEMAPVELVRVACSRIRRADMKNLGSLAKVPPMLEPVVQALEVLLNLPAKNWLAVRRTLTGPQFISKIRALDLGSITAGQFRKLRKMLLDEAFDDGVERYAAGADLLATWCRAVGRYLAIERFPGGPPIPLGTLASLTATPPATRPEVPETPPVRQAVPKRASKDTVQPARSPDSYLVFEPDIFALSENQRAQVRDLTITRPDVGQIVFHGVTDCRGIDFDEVVQFEIGEVNVYPDTDMKPAVGVELNKRATVRMYQCFPPGGPSIADDPQAAEAYRSKIRQMTEKKEAIFIDYDCATGVWECEVDHF